MPSHTTEILANLHSVAALRAEQMRDKPLQARIGALKSYQHRRFALTYADLLTSPRYAAAARFFLEHLYGPEDFTRRDDEFARVVPAIDRLFSEDVVATVGKLARLHALSERLDHDMARHLPSGGIDAEQYCSAWLATGRRDERLLQIDLVVQIGAALDRFTRSRLLRQTLHLMRKPARIAGLAELQNFLETGFDSFATMSGATEFLATIQTRERELADALFADDAQTAAVKRNALAWLP
jgi:hypothetical protein